MRAHLALCLVLALGGVVLIGPAGTPSAGHAANAAAVEAAALRWVGTGVAQPPRRDDAEWEVDVRRHDGSLVEVTLGEDAELLGLDEEAGARGGVAPDELSGPTRAAVAHAALAGAGPGRVLSVEDDAPGEIEVDVQRPDGVVLEVAVDDAFTVREVAREDAGDE